MKPAGNVSGSINTGSGQPLTGLSHSSGAASAALSTVRQNAVKGSMDKAGEGMADPVALYQLSESPSMLLHKKLYGQELKQSQGSDKNNSSDSSNATDSSTTTTTTLSPTDVLPLEFQLRRRILLLMKDKLVASLSLSAYKSTEEVSVCVKI